VKKFVLSIGCILSLLLPLAQAESPKEEELRVKLPPVVIVGEETLKAEALGRVPLPTLITTVHRERPPLEVGELGKEAEKTLERPSPTVRSPGCAYSTAVTATVAQVIKGIEALYKRGLYLYAKGDRAGARRTFDKLLQRYPKSLYASMALYWMGEIALEEGRSDEALEYFRRVSRDYPGSPYEDYALQSEAWILMERGRYGEALEDLRKLREATPRSPLVENSYLAEAYAKLLQGHIEEAYRATGPLLKEGGRFRAEGLYLRALCLFSLGRYEEAARLIGAFLKEDPSHPLTEGALFLEGWASWASGDPEGAVKAFQQYLKGYPRGRWRGPVMWGLIKALLNLGRVEEAKGALSRLLSGPEASSWGGEGLYEVARFSVSEGEDEEALEALRQIVQRYPQQDLLQRAYLLMGEVLSRRGELIEAAGCFQRAREGRPELGAYALLNEGLALYHAGKPAEAVRLWREFLSIVSPDSPLRERGLFFLGQGLLDLDRPKEAWSSFQGLPRGSELFRKALLSMGWYHFREGHWVEAGHWALRAGGPEGEFLRALVLFNLKEYRRALGLFRALRRSEDLPEDLSKRSFFYEGLCLYKLDDFSKASSLFREFLEAFPQDPLSPKALFWWGWSLLRLGHFREAEARFLRVAEGWPDNPLALKAWLKVGDCRYNLGEYDRAVLAYLRVKNRWPEDPSVPDAYWGIILSYYSAGKEERFRLWSDQLIRRYPKHPLAINVLLLLGEYYERKGEGKEAEGCYRKVLEAFPSSPGAEEARLKLAHLLEGAGKTSEALSVLAEVRRPPYRWKALYRMGRIHLSEGKRDLALRDLRELVEKASEDFAYQGALKAAEAFGGEAVGLLRRALERFPEARGAWKVLVKLGEKLLEAGRTEEALLAFQRAAARAPTEGLKARCELKVASILMKEDREEEALGQALRVLYLYPEEKEAGALALLIAAEIYKARGEGKKARQACRKALRLSAEEEVARRAKEICGKGL